MFILYKIGNHGHLQEGLVFAPGENRAMIDTDHPCLYNLNAIALILVEVLFIYENDFSAEKTAKIQGAWF